MPSINGREKWTQVTYYDIVAQLLKYSLSYVSIVENYGQSSVLSAKINAFSRSN